MLDIIKGQFDSGDAFASNKNYGVIKRDQIPSYFNDMYPLAQDYYHELNPFFVGKIYHPDLFNFSKVMTVRDGYVAFAHFLLTNHSKFSKFGTKLFLIPAEFTKLLPPNLLPYFGTWTIVQSPHKSMTIEKAKKVVITALATEDYLGDLEILESRLAPLKNTPKDATVEVYAPMRKNAFDLEGRESLVAHILVSKLKDMLPGKQIQFLNSKQFFDKTDFSNTYVFDLASDQFVVSDNYLHYYCVSRGATVNLLNSKVPKDSIFNLALSFNHELHVSPLPEVTSVFSELVLYSKSAATKDYLHDPNFHAVLRELFK